MRKPTQQFIGLSEFEIPDISPPPDEAENNNRLKEAIEGLNQIERAIILLYLDEKSYDEIAEIIGISNSNVGVRLNRIKQKLSKIIKPD
jgi:RNA polymerase sigma-70 factor (ECF subfamily)